MPLFLLASLPALAAQQAATPEGVPAWLWIVGGLVGGFFVKEIWPSLRGWIDADFKARRADSRRDAEDLTRRLLSAQETTATALTSIAESNKETAAALSIFASHRAADSLALDEIRRGLRRISGEPAEGRIVARVPTPAAAAEEVSGV